MNPTSSSMDFHTKALVLRAERQRLLASNIANADTPNYQARDFSFAQALGQATGVATAGTSSGSSLALAAPSAGLATAGMTNTRHIPLAAGGGAAGLGGGAPQGYAVQTQPSLDNNTVDLDRERAAFADNAVRYEATLRFINGQSKTLLAAITGQ